MRNTVAMATQDDKLLGEKLHYYCSSSEDEAEDNEPAGQDSVAPVSSDGGAAMNTGPKGVIKDWQRYKQLEREERAEQEAEKLALAKRLALTCRTDREDQEAKNKEQSLDEEFEVRNPCKNLIFIHIISKFIRSLNDLKTNFT